MFLEFAHFYQQFVQFFRWITALLISIRQTMISPAANKSISIKDSTNRVGGDKMIVEADVVDKESETRFFTPGARLPFAKLRHAFNTIPILHHFGPETDILGYATGEIFSQLTFDGSAQWHLLAFFYQKMISAKT